MKLMSENHLKNITIVQYILSMNISKNDYGDEESLLDYHTIFKIIYFADQAHLLKFGRPILIDDYYSMDYGPVPSALYDYFKQLRSTNGDEFFKEKNNKYIQLISKPNLEYLSESEIECLNVSINDNLNLDFDILTSKSHDKAYRSVSINTKIPLIEIAKAVDPSPEMLKYIEEQIENGKELECLEI